MAAQHPIDADHRAPKLRAGPPVRELKRVLGLDVRLNPAMPKDELRLEVEGRTVGRITGLGR